MAARCRIWKGTTILWENCFKLQIIDENQIWRKLFVDKRAFHEPMGKFESIVSLDDLKFLSVQVIENQQPLYTMEWGSPYPLCWVTCKLAYEGEWGNAPNILGKFDGLGRRLTQHNGQVWAIPWNCLEWQIHPKKKMKKIEKFMFNKQSLVIIVSTWSSWGSSSWEE